MAKSRAKKGRATGNVADPGTATIPKSRGTGFEAYFADPPITPNEAKIEQEIYSRDRPFVERIEECIQRYRNRRRFPNDLRHFFDLYLFLGGIDTTPRQFNGTEGLEHDDGSESESESEDEEADGDDDPASESRNNVPRKLKKVAAAMRRKTAMEIVQRSAYGSAKFYNPSKGSEHWDVDFSGVVAGFLSEALPRITGINYVNMERATSVVENFLRYVLHHDVCPEYAADVREAIDLCERARTDLPLAHAAMSQFPGQFNLAATELFCPHFVVHPHDDDVQRAFRRPDDFNPSVVFRTGILLQAPPHVAQNLIKTERGLSGVRILCEQERDLEVVAIHQPSKEHVELYKRMSYKANDKPKQGNSGKEITPKTEGNGQHDKSQETGEIKKSHFTPVGTATLRTTHIEDGWYDPDTEAAIKAENGKEQDYILDKNVLAFLKPGMKLRLRIADISLGIPIIMQALQVVVPWYTFLPQTLMHKYVDPKPTLRPAPSAKDADEDGGDGAQGNGDGDGDGDDEEGDEGA